MPLVDGAAAKRRQSNNWKIEMIVVKNGCSCGVSIFFPGALANGRTFKVVDLRWAERYALPRTVFHLIVVTLAVAMSKNSDWLRVLDMVIVCYVVLYTASVKRVSMNVAVERVTYSLAPAMIWLAHFSYFGLLLTCLLIGTDYTYQPVNVLTVFAVFITVVVAAFLIAPVWAYISYKRECQHV